MDAHFRLKPLMRKDAMDGASRDYDASVSAISSGSDRRSAAVTGGVLQTEMADFCSLAIGKIALGKATNPPAACADTIRDIAAYSRLLSNSAATDYRDEEVTCPRCVGRGRVHFGQCSYCVGAGRLTVRVPFYCRHPDRCLGGSCKEEIACNE